MRVRLAALALFLVVLAPRAGAQSTAINCTIEGVVKDTTGAVLSGATVTVTNVDVGAERSLISGSDGEFRAPLLPLGTYKVRVELPGFKAAERTGLTLSAGQTAVLNFALEVGGVQEVVSIIGRAARRPAGQDRPRPHDLRLRDQEPAPGLPQPLQLRLPAGQRHRVREQRVRGASHQRQRLADAHELPDRRQHQHPEGPRGAAPAPDLGGGGAGGQGHHLRLRPRVRPDHGHGLQRRDPVGHQRRARLPDLPLPARGHDRAPVLPLPHRAQARQQHRQLDGDAGRADRAGQVALLRGLRVRGPGSPGRDQGDPRPPSTTPRRLGLSSTAIPADGVIPTEQHVNFAIAKTDYQISPAHKLSARYFFFKNRSPYNIGTRLQYRRPRHRLQRPHGLGFRPADLLLRAEPAERAARAVRAPPPVPDRERERGRRAPRSW